MTDWAQESANMGQIYKNSVLTIAATASPDSERGCFNISSHTQDELRHGDHDYFDRFGVLAEIKHVLEGGGTLSLLIWRPNDFDPNSEPHLLKWLPIFFRGWIFQERILSKRLVHYTSNQLVWECRQSCDAEDGLQQDQGLLRIRLKDLQVPREEFIKHWYLFIVRDHYSRLRFTKHSDRLIAISGVARVFYEMFGMTYVAGFWIHPNTLAPDAMTNDDQNYKELKRALCWGTIASSRQPRRRYFPSWSWANCHNSLWFAIRYPTGLIGSLTSHTQEEISEPLHPNTPLKLNGFRIFFRGEPADPFGHIDSGCLFVEGVVISGLLQQSAETRSGLVINHRSFDIQLRVCPDWRTQSMLPTCVWCLDMETITSNDGHIFIVLEEIAGVADSYVRIGVAYLPENRRTNSVRHWLESGTKRAIKLY
jgi:hypothetical protein